MLKYLTKDNITFVLALFGSLGTVISFLSSYYKARQNFSIDLVDLGIGESGILCYLTIFNKSSKQLIITDMSIKTNNLYFPAIKIPEIVQHSVRRSGNEITDVHSNYSLAFPVILASEYATSGYFYFPFPKGISTASSSTFSLKVCTSHGNSVEKTLSLQNTE